MKLFMSFWGIFFGISIVFFSCATTKPVNTNMVADVDPLELGSVTIAFDKLFSSALEQKNVALVFEPRYNRVYLQFKYQTVTYRQYWDASGREQFIAAVKHYHQDYDARTLIAKPSKFRPTYGAYGALNSTTEWGQFSFSINARAHPRLELGYLFKKDNPYFTVLQREAPGDAGNHTSLRIILYFTRAQADDLARFFDQDYLLAFLDEQGISRTSNTVVADEYNN
ncbi:MAG: hypothetical protein LBT14_07060 [Treponema sp.]|jgi:hypothetical protein|nr:hypothetical protein [Treponema sp.]